MNETIFISDMHFSENTIDFNKLIKVKLSQWLENKIDSLYMLGDIFDVWIGDDDNSSYILDLIKSFKLFAEKIPLYLMHGNRDFLLSEEYIKKNINATLLNDPCIVNIYGENYILTHGDLICTLDIKYQEFRKQTHNKIWQQEILKKPLAERRILAQQIRNLSDTKKYYDSNNSIYDITQDGINLIQKTFQDVEPTPKTLIHGHTHKPNICEEFYMNKPFKRVIIPDWNEKKTGCVIIDNKNNIKIQYF